MYEFYKIKLFLLCICAIFGNFEQVVGIPKTAVEQKVVLPSHIATVTDGILERNKRGLLDYLLSELFEYFDYSDEDDSEEDEKYLICRNCTIVISQSGNQENAVIRPTTAPVPMEPVNKVNGGDRFEAIRSQENLKNIVNGARNIIGIL
ncbi:uncharacterized protein LOC129236202 isoform X2 [Anastrepha obliqua]|uniref:uncharacterized protein LOC129236202 isoform X2 n=1 Tax=Anastrepha obliqua TaxID=95512 RepID=UPI00240A5F40|nr:uncharacterized protein LOC129236202 isoform X2 [Anastrepha obliqua]